jgi:acyl-CoA reductase-like NAD-dependent aldehyde dehydrogenase
LNLSVIGQTAEVARRISVVDPATGKTLGDFESADTAAVNAAAVRARAAHRAWREVPLRKRLEVVAKFQHILAERKREIATVITSEAGKPLPEALLTEVLVVLDAARFLLQKSYAFLQEESVAHGSLATKAKRGRVLREPYGVVGIISPWNYPFAIPGVQVLTAVVAGNAVVLKPSELTPFSSLKIAELLSSAGLPPGVLEVVPGDGTTGAALVDATIDKLIFTGSVATGKRIAQSAAARLLPVVLELGGKDPMIVLDDADIDVASSGATWGAFVNAGQACLSVERCYVHRSIYESFLSACVEKARQLRVGNGAEPGIDVGPMIHERQLKTVEEHVAEAKSLGARLLIGGERLSSLGPNFYAPTILADVNHQMRIMREETFGPVLPIMPFDSDDEAVRLANDSQFGLAASIWTRDRARGERVARQIQAGTVMINDAVSCFAISEAPHGGVKASGIGRTHGLFGLEEMVQIKYLDSDLIPKMKKPWWYGYGANLSRSVEAFLDFQFANSFSKRWKNSVSSLGLVSRKRR